MAIDIYVKLKRILFKQERFGVGRATKNTVMRAMGLKNFEKLSRINTARVVEFFKKNIDYGSEFAEKRSLEHDYLLNSECYRAFRQINNLPCHGQRTQTNAGTCKRKRGNQQSRRKFGKTSAQKILTIRSQIRQKNSKKKNKAKIITNNTIFQIPTIAYTY